jgi:hypothetical protein
MALALTTNSAAIAAGDASIVVASATGFAAGYLVRVGDEMMRVTGGYVSGTTIPVLRGQEGTTACAHGVTTGVVVGIASDWNTSIGASTVTAFPLAGKARRISTYGAAGAIALPLPGTDEVAIINGTSALAMTLAVPTKDMDGTLLWIASNGVGAHTVTVASGLSGAGSNYDVLTVNATAPVLIGPLMAVNSLWQCGIAVAMAGNAATITGTLA